MNIYIYILSTQYNFDYQCMEYPVYDLFMHLSKCAHNPSKHLLNLLSPFIHLPICKIWIAITFYTEELYKICNVTSVFMQTKLFFKSTVPKDIHDFLHVSWGTYLLEWKVFKKLWRKMEHTSYVTNNSFTSLKAFKIPELDKYLKFYVQKHHGLQVTSKTWIICFLLFMPLFHFISRDNQDKIHKYYAYFSMI
jgi:hypothetical protein